MGKKRGVETSPPLSFLVFFVLRLFTVSVTKLNSYQVACVADIIEPRLVTFAKQRRDPCSVPLACEQALLFGRAKRVSRERASGRRSRQGQKKGELATISHKFSFVLHPDKGKYHWLKNDVPENKVD